MPNKSHSQTRTILELVVSLIVVVALVLILEGMGAFSPKPGTRRITFRVLATGGFANITLKAGDNHIDKGQTLTTPWEQTYDIASSETVYLTASNPTQTGQLTCLILLDHSNWKKSTTEAPKNGVACAAIIP